jgi:putative transposase
MAKQKKRERHIKRAQRKLARQNKDKKGRKRTKARIAKLHRKTRQVRTDFLHKTIRTLVNTSKIIVLEDLKLKGMTARAKPKVCPFTGKWLRNNAAAKSGLNKALLGVGLYQLEVFISYKAARANKPVFKVSAYNTSRECAVCGHTHEANRPSQATFHCQSCGHTDNADRNAACVIKKRAISLIKNSGTELSLRGVLRLVKTVGPADNATKTEAGKPASARRAGSKKKVEAA